jgi:Tfp pilus assembly protein PilN
MIEIDLLPLELREKKIIPFEQFFQTKLFLTILGCLVLFHLFLYTANVINSRRLDTLQANWQNLSSKRAEIDRLKGERAEINRKIPLIEQLISNRLLWSRELNIISDLLIAGIWLNELSLEKQKTAKDGVLESLIIRGSAASRTKDEPALIGRFMQNLKDDSVFSANFTVELGPIKKRLIGQTEVMDFILICRFKQNKPLGISK